MCHSAIGLDAIHGAGRTTHGCATTSIDAYATANRTAGSTSSRTPDIASDATGELIS